MLLDVLPAYEAHGGTPGSSIGTDVDLGPRLAGLNKLGSDFGRGIDEIGFFRSGDDGTRYL